MFTFLEALDLRLVDEYDKISWNPIGNINFLEVFSHIIEN